MSRTICTSCTWNHGVKTRKNAFGYPETFRDCGCFGYLQNNLPVRKCGERRTKEVSNG